MCLGIPGRVVQIDEASRASALTGKVDFAGIRKDVCLAYLPEIRVGDYVIVHVGFAITQVDEDSATESLRVFQAMGLLDEELGVGDPEAATPPECPVPAWNLPPA